MKPISKEVVDEYLEELKTINRKDNTLKNYEKIISRFRKFLYESGETDKVEVVKKYIKFLKQNKGYKNGSLITVTTTLKLFLEYAGYDCSKIKIPKQDRKLPKHISEDEVKRLIGMAQNSKNRAIISTLAITGLRVSELVNVNVGDIDFKNRKIIVRNGKGGKGRIVFFDPDTAKMLKELTVNATHKEEPVFKNRDGTRISSRSIQRMVKKEGKKLDLKVTPHVLRHSLAVALLDRGLDLQRISRILGHSNLNTTAIYLNISDSELSNGFFNAID